MKITVATTVKSERKKTWDAWNNPADIMTIFDAENENPAELQRNGWQAILDRFARHVQAKVQG